MPVILVVEPEPQNVDRIVGALGATGWQVRAVASVPAALEFTASEAPLLFVVSSAVPGAIDLLDPFARRRGGPGAVAMVPAGGSPGVGLHADEVLTHPFSDDELRAAVDRTLRGASRRVVPEAPSDSPKLTSQDIFGDLVADLDDAVQTVAPPSGPPPPRPPRPSTDSLIDKKLEETLSGILGIPSPSKPAAAPPPAPAPPRPATPAAATAPPAAPTPLRRPGGADVDALLTQTLSGLDLGVGKKPAAPPPPSPPAPSPPRRTQELDFSRLEELTKGGGRSTEPPRPAPPASPSPPPSVVAPPTPPPAAAAPPADPLAGLDPWEKTPTGLKPIGGPPPVAPVQVAPPAPEPTPVPAAPPAPTPPAVRAPVEAGQRFGQYLLLEKIGVGGMAEVWKARSQGVEGFQKTVAIKRILPHLTDSADFVTMFVDEAKLAAQLTHDNIIQIFDLDKLGDDYYMAMEYVEGENLRGILNKARDLGEPIPAAIALQIAMRLASALGYAHRKRDFDGHELGLVHRDVSPQNVLVSYEGNVKLCDFGIVKAVARTGHTQMGALKGKLQYMSPEQAWGRPVDSRSDLFSVGVLLFEMLTGRRLFTGDSEMQLLEAVRDCRVQAPSEANPDIPVAVDVVVAKALARDPVERYQTADELIQALQSLLAKMQPPPTLRDVAAYMRSLFRGGGAPELPSFPPEPEAPAPGFVPPLMATAPAQVPASPPVPLATVAFPALSDSELPELPAAVEPEPPEPAVEPKLDWSPEIVHEPLESYLPEPAPLLTPVTPEPPAPAPEPNATIALPVARRVPEPIPVPIRPAPPEVVEVEPVTALPGVAVEESSKGRGWLVAAILAALAVGGGLAWYLTRNPAPPAGPELSPAPVEGTAGEEVPPPPVDAATDTPLETGGQETAPPASPTTDIDLDRAIEEKAASKEAELRRQFEAESRRIQQEIEAAKKRGEPPPTPAAAPPQAAPEPAPVTTPPPVASEPPPTPSPPPQEESAPATPPPEPAPSPAPVAAPGPSTKLGDLVSMGPGVTPPQLVTFTKPQYPPLARKLRVTGEVVVSVLVDENGAVREVRLQKGVGQNVGLNEAALEAARGARYRPPTKDGVRVRMWTTLKIPFQL